MTQENTDQTGEERTTTDQLLDRLHETARKQGIFTERDREYLLHPERFSGQQERSIRYRIRQRLFHGLIDLILLNNFDPQNEHLEHVVTSRDDLPPEELIWMFATLTDHSAHFADETAYRENGTDSPLEFLEQQLETGLEQAELEITGREREDQKITVDVDISFEEFNEDILFYKILAGDATIDDLWEYLVYGDEQRLREELEKRDRDIVIRDAAQREEHTVTIEEDALRISKREIDDEEFAS